MARTQDASTGSICQAVDSETEPLRKTATAVTRMQPNIAQSTPSAQVVVRGGADWRVVLWRPPVLS